ncbi:MAG: leucine-rich repeat domain-containing protein [Clostridia bacterium]|nr:leucine-rich repeat domain-containing protein [Clostridia bacterium]
MRKFLTLTLLVLTLLFAACLCACTRTQPTPQPVQGEKGEKGESGVGIQNVEAVNGELIVTYTDGRRQSLGYLADLVEGEDLGFYPLSDGTYAVDQGDSIYLEKIVIPETYKGRAVTKIVNNAFTGCKSLKEIYIPNGVTSIGKNAFNGCGSLKKISIPNSVVNIGEGAFNGCPLEYNEFENGQYLGSEENPYHTFVRADLFSSGKVELSKDTKVLCESAFWNHTEITEIVIPNTVSFSGYSVFKGCDNLQSLTIPFVGDGLENTHLGYMFGAQDHSKNSQCVPLSLTSVTVTGDKEIGECAFYYCRNIEKIVLPQGLEKIGARAFYNCTGLEEINLPNSICEIGESGFYNCVSLKEVIIPEGVRVISPSAFRACTSLTRVTLHGKITNIEGCAFMGCTTLKRIYIPASVERIENEAFKSCAMLSIFCEAPKRPSGWNLDWNITNCPVIWNS